MAVVGAGGEEAVGGAAAEGAGVGTVGVDGVGGGVSTGIRLHNYLIYSLLSISFLDFNICKVLKHLMWHPACCQCEFNLQFNLFWGASAAR